MDEAQRKKDFYTRQRLNAESGAREGDTNAQKATAKIYSKLGKSVPKSERLGAGKPGASEGEQMLNVASIGAGAGDIIGGLRAAVPMAEAGVKAALGRGAGQIAKRTIPGAGPRVVGKATVEDVGRTASRRALGPGKPKPLARQLTEQGRSPRGSGLGESGPVKGGAKRGASKAPDLDKTAKGAPRKVNPRAAGTHPRAMGTNPRAVAARRKAAEEAAQTGTGIPTRRTVGTKAADIIRKGGKSPKKKT